MSHAGSTPFESLRPNGCVVTLGLLKVGTCQVCARQIRSAEDRVAEHRTMQDDCGEVCTSEVHAPKPGIGEICAREIRFSQHRPSKNGPLEVRIAEISGTQVHALEFNHLPRQFASSSQDCDRSLNIRCSDLEQRRLGSIVRTFLHRCECRGIVMSPGRFESYVGGQQFVDGRAQLRGSLSYLLKGIDRPDPNSGSFVAELLDRPAELLCGLPFATESDLCGAGVQSLPELLPAELKLTPCEVGPGNQEESGYPLQQGCSHRILKFEPCRDIWNLPSRDQKCGHCEDGRQEESCSDDDDQYWNYPLTYPSALRGRRGRFEQIIVSHTGHADAAGPGCHWFRPPERRGNGGAR